MLFEKIDNDLKDFPKDLRDFIYSIDVTMPLNDIFNELFSFFELNMKQLKCFDPCGTVYCGFTLQDIKEPIFDCLAASVYLYLEEKLLASKGKKTQRELIYTDDNEQSNPDPSKRISRNKSMVQKKQEMFWDNCDLDYYKCHLQILRLKSNAIIRSLELSRFFFSNTNIKFVNEYISQRFDIMQFSKLSQEIRNYIESPDSYSDENIPFTPEKFLSIDFENAFHTSLFNQVIKYLYYIDDHQNYVKLKTEEFICAASLIITLPPYWLKSTETSSTIIDKICNHIMHLNFKDAILNLYKTTELTKNMIHYPLEVALSYIVRKKYKPRGIKDAVHDFLNDVKTTNLKIYNGSVYLDQFNIDILDEDLELNRKHYLLVNALAMLPNYIDFNYDEYNMFYILCKYDKRVFDFLQYAINTMKKPSEFTHDGFKYSNCFLTMNDIFNSTIHDILKSGNFEDLKENYFDGFPENRLFANRVKYLNKNNFLFKP